MDGSVKGPGSPNELNIERCLKARIHLHVFVQSTSSRRAKRTHFGGFGTKLDVFQSCKMRSNPNFKLPWRTMQAMLNGSGRFCTMYGVPSFEALRSDVTT